MTTKGSKRIFQYLTKLALDNEGTKGRFRLAAGIVHKKSLIATGVNSYKSHPLMLQFGKNSDSIFLHAEVDAIKNALRLLSVGQLKDCDMYVVRVKRDGSYGLAKPCEGCRNALALYGLKNVYYTHDGCVL